MNAVSNLVKRNELEDARLISSVAYKNSLKIDYY